MIDVQQRKAMAEVKEIKRCWDSGGVSYDFGKLKLASGSGSSESAPRGPADGFDDEDSDGLESLSGSDSDLDETSAKKPSGKPMLPAREGDTSDDDLGPAAHSDCNICGGGHWTSSCSYWKEIPAGGNVNVNDYIIVCECGKPLINGNCTRGFCASWLPKRVISKALVEHLKAY